LKKCIYSTYSPLSSTHLWICCSNFFNPSKKNSFGHAANKKSQRLISTPTYLKGSDHGLIEILSWHFFLNWCSGGWSPVGSTRPIVPAPGDYDDGEIGMIGRGNRSTRRKPAPVPLCPPQTPHPARTRTRAAAVGSQRLTAWATARPSWHLSGEDMVNHENSNS
jgi:hypothetical protein